MIILNSVQYLLLVVIVLILILGFIFLKVSLELKSSDNETYKVTLGCACVACIFLCILVFSPLNIVKEEVVYTETLNNIEVKSYNSKGIPEEYLVTYKGKDGLDKTYCSDANSTAISISNSDTDTIEEIEGIHSLFGGQMGVTLSSYHLYLSADTYNSLYKE